MQIEKCIQTDSLNTNNEQTQIDHDDEESMSQCTSMSLSQTNNDKS